MSDIHDKYPSNSINQPPQANNRYEPPMAPMVDPRQVTTQQSRIVKKLKNMFRVDYDYFMEDVIIPGAWNFFKNGVESAMWRNRYPRDPGRPYYDNPSYSSYYDYSRPYRSSYGGRPYDEFREESQYENYNRRMERRNEPEKTNYQDIVIVDNGHPDNRGRYPIDIAHDIVQTMRNICTKDGFVTVQHLLYLAGQRSDYTDNYYGWYNPNDIDFKRVPRGYLIIVPPAQPIYNRNER